MNKTTLISGLTRAFYRTGFKFRKHSPEVLVVTGAVAMIAGTVSACRATTRVSDAVELGKAEIEEALAK